MNHPHTGMLRHIVIGVGVFLILTMVGLLSWNTLSELFNLPHAQLRHAVAVLSILMITGWTLRGSHGRHHADRQRHT